MTSNNSVSLDTPTLRSLIDQYRHRLIALELELKDYAAGLAVPNRRYTKSVALLKEVSKVLHSLSEAVQQDQDYSAPDDDQTKAALFGMPPLDAGSIQEKIQTANYLNQSNIELEELLKDINRVYVWVNQIVSGKSNVIQTTLRLSALRKILTKFDQRLEMLRVQKIRSERFTKSILSKFNKSKDHRMLLRDTMDGLASLLKQINGRLSSIADLKARVRTAQMRHQQMELWLEDAERKSRSEVAEMDTPSLLGLAQLNGETRSMLSDESKKLNRRVHLVNRYWQYHLSDRRNLDM